jgi:hypothetical protein
MNIKENYRGAGGEDGKTMTFIRLLRLGGSIIIGGL